MDIRPLRVGVEITGLDLSQAIPEADGAELRRLLAERQLLVFRGQTLSPTDQIRVLSTFGPVLDEKQDGKSYQYVSGEQTSVKPTRLLFHSDNHFTPVPLELLSLYGEEVGDAATPTLFADNMAGYRRLPQDVTDRLKTPDIINRSFFFLGYSDRTARSVPEEESGGPVARHPAIWHHPETGAPFVYLTELHAFRLDGIDAAESDALLETVFDTIYDPALLYEHQWRNDDLVIWNNRTVQHARGPLPESQGNGTTARSIRRVSVGTTSFLDQFQFTPETIAAIPEGDAGFYKQTLEKNN